MRLFVSYSRRDAARADAIVAALESREHEVVIDRRDLPFGEHWQDELAEFIRTCDTVVWLVSEESVRSRWCRWELGEVQRCAKRLLPVRIGDVDADALPEELGRIHCLPAVGSYDHDRHFDALCSALDADRGWIRDHTRLADRAREWQHGGRAVDRLLRGNALREAEAWADVRPARVPPPTAEVGEFLTASRRAAQRRTRRLLTASLMATVVTSALALFAWWQRSAARANEQRAERQADANDGLRREAEATAVRTAEQRAELLAGICDRQQDPLVGVLVALEAWSGAGGTFAGFAALDRFRAAAGADDDAVPLPSLEELGAIPDYAAVVGRIVERLPRIRELRAFGESWQNNRWAFTPAARRLAVLRDDDGSGGHVWDVDTGAVVAEFDAAGERIEAFTISADGAYLAAGTWDGELRCWDARTGALRFTRQIGDRPIDPVVFLGDTHRLALGFGRSAAVVDVDRVGDDPARLEGMMLDTQQDAISRFATSGDGQRLLASTERGHILAWDLGDGRVLHDVAVGRSCLGLLISTDGYRAATRAHGGRLVVCQVDTGETLFAAEDMAPGGDWTLRDDGALVCYTRTDGKVVVHHLDGDEPDRVLSATTGRIEDLLCIAEPPQVIASYEDGRVCVWPRQETWPTLTLNVDERGSLDLLAWDAATGRLLGTSYNGPARLFSVDEPAPPTELPGGELAIGQLRSSGDGRFLFGNGVPRGLATWSTAERRLVTELPDARVLPGLVLTLDGERVLAVDDGRACLVTLADGARRDVAAFDGIRAAAAVLSNDRRLAVLSAPDHAVAFADLGAGERAVAMTPPTRGIVLSAARHTAADLLATTSEQGDVDLWRLGTGGHLLRIPPDADNALLLQWHRDGASLDVLTATGTLRRFAVVRGSDGATLDPNEVPIPAAATQETAFALMPVPSSATLQIGDMMLRQIVWSRSRTWIQGPLPAVSPDTGMVAEWVDDRDGRRILLHPLPEVVSRFVAPRGRARGRAAAATGGVLSADELQFWSLERQRHVFDLARRAVPRRLSPFERQRYGLGAEPAADGR